MHNVVITSIIKDGIAMIPEHADVGYDDPRIYLPDEIVELLDRAFLAEAEFEELYDQGSNSQMS